MANPGSEGASLADVSLLLGGPKTFGGGSVPINTEGNISRQVFGLAAGVTPGSTAADVVVAIYSLPAGSLDAAGRGLTVKATGFFAANANNKRIKLWWAPTTAVVNSAITGGSLMADTGVVATNGGAWELGGNVFKRGAAGSNTQLVSSNGAAAGAAHVGVTPELDAVAVESGAILVAVTINNTTTATDAGISLLEVNAKN